MSPRIIAILTALAANLGSVGAAERVPPGEPARACPRHGPGFVEVPGTGTCIRIDGRVRAEAGTATRRVGREDIVGLRTQGSVSADTRTDTAYGPLRTYVRMRATTENGLR